MQLDSKDVMLSFVQKYVRDNVNTVNIGKVVGRSSFNNMQCVDVNIQVSRLYKNGDVLPYTNQVLYNIPVVFPSGGMGGMTFPIAIGDNVLLLFGQRNIESWLLGDGDREAIPADSRHYSEDDAIAIPCIHTSKNNLSPSLENFKLWLRDAFFEIKPTGRMEIANPNGSLVIESNGSFSYRTGDIVITALNSSGDVSIDNGAVEFDLDGDGSCSLTNGSGTITMNAGGTINLNGVTISPSGAISTPSSLSVTGSTTLGATVTSAGVNIGSTHVHGGIQTGGSLSLVPQ